MKDLKIKIENDLKSSLAEENRKKLMQKDLNIQKKELEVQ